MAAPEFSRLVTLACHDLRTPLATVNGFAKTLLRRDRLEQGEAHFVELIDEAAEQMNDLLDLLGLAARIEAGTYDPALREVDTLALVRSDDERVGAAGTGETVEADAPTLSRSLSALATAAIRHGGVEHVSWTVRGRVLELAPVAAAAAGVVTGEEPKELGVLVARLVIERRGGSLALDGENLRVQLG
jgi:signal transduction histidine kinase